jgi:hypothetical protein
MFKLALAGEIVHRAASRITDHEGNDQVEQLPQIVQYFYSGRERYIQDELLGGFDVIFSYDLGNGLTVERGAERLAQWGPRGHADHAAGTARGNPFHQPVWPLPGQSDRHRA